METDQGMVMEIGTAMVTGMETDQVMVMAVVITVAVTMADIIHIMEDTEATMVAGVIGEVPC